MKGDNKKDEFVAYMDKVVLNLKAKNYKVAREYIYKAMVIDDSAPQIHNLLGILYELNKNIDLAQRHYSAAYALNANFRPAINNLERVSDFSYKYNTCDIDYGTNKEYDESQIYKVVYDEKNIGKLVKLNYI